MKSSHDQMKELTVLSVEEIKIDSIRLDGPNIRAGDVGSSAEDEELTESIRIHGVLQSIVVFINDASLYELLAGKRRVICARKAGRLTVPARIVEPPRNLAAHLLFNVHENGHRCDIDPVPFAESLAKIQELEGWSNDELVRASSFKPAKICRLLQLASQSDEIKQLVKNGSLGLTTALELGKLPEEEQAELIQQIQSGMMVTRNDLIDRRQAKKKPASKASKRLARATAQLDGGRSVSVTVPGESLNIDSFLECLEQLIPKVRRAKQAGIQLKSLLSMIRDQHLELSAQ